MVQKLIKSCDFGHWREERAGLDSPSLQLYLSAGEGAMSEVIQTDRYERIDRCYADVVDEVRVMAEAGDHHDQSRLSAGVVGRFLARFNAPVQAY
jgi:hypothetical protein